MSTNTQQPLIATVTRQFRVPAERVFDAWLDPALAGKWLFTDGEGELVRVEIDPRVGGAYCFTDRRAEGDIDHVGEYLEIDRPRRLVFTLKVPLYSQDADTVAVDIIPLATGCELTITHAMSAENAEWLEPTTQGWAKLLDVLETRLDG